MIREAIARVSSGTDLTPPEAMGVMEEIMRGAATPAQIGGFLTALRMKGETEAEITAFARVMRAAAIPVSLPAPEARVDTCGTGGDGAGTFNISTAAAFVAAGAGVSIVKHGNRGVSSRCGSADVLEALGVSVTTPPDRVPGVLAATGIAFLFAPVYHPAMQHARSARQEIGIRTIFNLLGPLTNPGRVGAHLLGVYDPRLTAPVARVLGDLGARRAMVVHGAGLDEITTTGSTVVAEPKTGRSRPTPSTAPDLGSHGLPSPPSEAADLRRTPGSSSRSLQVVGDPPGISSSSTPGRRSTSARRPPISPGESLVRLSRSTRGRRSTGSSG